MKTRTASIFILLVLLWVLPIRSLAAANDTILNYAFLEGKIVIRSGSGELYPFAHDLYGYKTIYYLFTVEDYLHLDTTDITDESSYYCFMDETPQANWYNSENKGTAKDDVKWPLKYTGKDSKDKECVENNPNRFMRRTGDEAPIQLLFNADGNRQKKADSTTVLLVVMPPLKDKIDSKRYAQDFKVNYGGHNGKELKDYYNEVILTRNDTVLDDLEYVIGCYDHALIDYVTANGVLIPVKDSMFGKKDVVVPLKAIPITYDKPVAIDIHYRYFGNNGEITSHKDSRTLSLHWKKTNVSGWVMVLVIFGIIAAIIILEKLISFMLNKNNNHPKQTESGEEEVVSNESGKRSGSSRHKRGGDKRNSGSSGKKKSPKDEEKTEGKKKGIRGLFSRFSRKSEAKSEQSPEEQIKSLIESLRQKEDELERVNNQLSETQQELERVKTALSNAQETAQTDLSAIKKQHEKELKDQESEWSKKEESARKAQQKAEKERDQAQEQAKAEYEKQKKVLEENCKKKVEDAEAEASKARSDAEQKIIEMHEQCDERLKRWTDDRTAILEQLKDNVKYLTAAAGQMPANAFKGHCEKIVNGTAHYEEELCKRIESYVCEDLTIDQCLAKERKEVCRILDSGSNSWMNLLGRLYSYLSVDALRQQLTIDGVSAEQVTDAFETMQTVLASLGIIVLNCSLGYDSGDNPNTARLFEPKSSVDLITEWLGGDDAVQKAIPKHGQNVYDFGQLAYLNTEDRSVHPGIVIYYNS